ncbi:MAG: glycosyltransferase [Dehalococcoidia bacterium]|nr:glycosyltransferase [Dehalococcoidia bacterium]MCL4232687.1 glycosyltransferase [Dehalococcoidia bacterium]NUQ54842.1 glycosyltransferase [Dehalococcoidia bacterium]
MTKILVLSRAFVGRKMASPGIRAYHLAGALGRALPEAEVTLAIPGDKGEVALPAPNVRLQVWDGNSSATALARSHDIAIARNFPPHFARLLGTTRFALDAFTPLYIEWMELSKRDIVPRWRRTWMSGNRWYLNFQLTLADFIFCADERQRDMWIGMLMALALVPPEVYERDPSLRRLIDLVPYGVPRHPLDARGPVLRGVVPKIKPGDRVLLWNGGVTEWNDPFTLLQAMDEITLRRQDVHLVFMGSNHPDYVFGPTTGVLGRAIEMAKELGLFGKTVHFLEGWVPYERIDDYLAEADASVCLGYENLESRFAFRTRYVDLFRARVPFLCTRGDVLAERVEDEQLGITVPERDVQAVKAGIERLLDDVSFAATCRENLGRIAPTMSWDIAAEPLVRFCASTGSYATPARQRRAQALTRAGMYLAMKKICQSPPLH